MHIARDALGSDAVKSCVVDVIRRVKFPPADGGDVTVSSSLVFQPCG